MKNTKYERYLIVSDESIKEKGQYYSYFFGGAIIKESKYEELSQIINAYKQSLGLNELKRTKITNSNALDYIKILDLFFTFVKTGQIKVRIMYAPNKELSHQRHGQDDAYCKFYYAFLKIGFSLFYSKQNIVLRLIFDELPESPSKRKELKETIVRNFSDISNKNKNNKVLIYKNRIQEANSKLHPILQCIDVITGVIEYYLNNANKEEHSKKGLAKIKIFKHIYDNYIIQLCPNFNLYRTTNNLKNYKAWKLPYTHIIYKHTKKDPDLPT